MSTQGFERYRMAVTVIGAGCVALAGAPLLSQTTATGPAAEATARRMPLPARVQMRQWSATASGPAALGSVLATYGRRLSPAQLETLCDAAGKKATLVSLQAAARDRSFKTAIVTATPDGLARQPLPAIAEWSDGDFRVFISSRGSAAEVFDPGAGARGWHAPEQLTGKWTGRLLVLHPASL